MTLILWLSGLCLLAGTIFTIGMTIGMLRFPDAYTRLHAGTKGLTIGGGFILLGAALQAPDVFFALRILLVGLFLLLTNPISMQAIARASYRAGQTRQHLILDEYQEFLQDKMDPPV